MATYPLPVPEKTFLGSETHGVRRSPPVLTDEDRAQMRAKRAQTVAGWSKLPLRQTWADEHWMRGFLVKYGVRIASDLEPATPTRLQTMLRRAGLTRDQWSEAVGCTLSRYLKLNPNLPLWAATALVLEASD